MKPVPMTLLAMLLSAPALAAERECYLTVPAGVKLGPQRIYTGSMAPVAICLMPDAGRIATAQTDTPGWVIRVAAPDRVEVRPNGDGAPRTRLNLTTDRGMRYEFMLEPARAR